MKTIYFLTGLPRAGNTLLASILNQNPKINATGLAYITNMMFECYKYSKTNATAQHMKDRKSFNNAVSPMLHNYYKDWTGDIIIQRSPAGRFIEIAMYDKFLKNDFKCVVLVRDIFEVIASFLRLADEDPKFYINKQNRESISSKVSFLMEKDGIISTSLESIYNLYYGWNENAIFIQYNDLVNDTQKQINRIYDFLDIEPFEHSFTNLKQLEVNNLKYDDSMYGKNLHKIKTEKISKSNNSKYLQMIPEKYLKSLKNTNNWLNEL